MFNKYVEVDESDSISSDELKSLLLNLNLNLTQALLEDYKEAHLSEIGADSSRSGENLTWEQFYQLYSLILKNQTSLFREILNEKPMKEMNIQEHLAKNEKNLKECFKAYDTNKTGYLDYQEFVSMLLDLNLNKQFQKHIDPAVSFQVFCHQMWTFFDINADGNISFDEFIRVYNEFLDR